MTGLKVAIIGAGAMGALLAERLPAGCRKVIIARRKAKAVAVADEVGGVASEQPSAVRGCQVVFLAVPGSEVAQLMTEVLPHLDSNALVVNLAIELMTDELAAAFPEVRFAAAKVIGHAHEMGLGSPGVVVLDLVSGVEEERLRHLLAGLGHIVKDEESKVLAASRVVIEVMGHAAAELRTRLAQLGLSERLVQAAITTAGPGVLREGDPILRVSM